MFMGELLKNRMDSLGISVDKLSEDVFLDADYITSIIYNKIKVEDIDEIDLEFISSALFCEPEYFIDSEVRKKDIIHASMNRGNCDPRTNKVKGKLQQFAKDFIFIEGILEELESGETWR